MVLGHCRLANEADSPTSGARGGLSIQTQDSRTRQVLGYQNIPMVGLCCEAKSLSILCPPFEGFTLTLPY
jgi:hypothetical protein